MFGCTCRSGTKEKINNCVFRFMHNRIRYINVNKLKSPWLITSTLWPNSELKPSSCVAKVKTWMGVGWHVTSQEEEWAYPRHRHALGYSLSHGDDAQLPKVRTTSFGVESIAYLGNKLWQILPQEIKQSNSLPIFKKQIKCWNGGKCNCRLCKVYIPKVGFLTG